MIQNLLSFHSELNDTLSLVVPGISLTIEILLPAILLNRVDLPTFGLPTIVIIGIFI